MIPPPDLFGETVRVRRPVVPPKEIDPNPVTFHMSVEAFGWFELNPNLRMGLAFHGPSEVFVEGVSSLDGAEDVFIFSAGYRYWFANEAHQTGPSLAAALVVPTDTTDRFALNLFGSAKISKAMPEILATYSWITDSDYSVSPELAIYLQNGRLGAQLALYVGLVF